MALEGSIIQPSENIHFCIEIIIENRKYMLKAADSDSAKSWIVELRKAALLTFESKYEVKEILGR